MTTQPTRLEVRANMQLDELMSNPLYEALKLAVGMLSLHGYEDEAKKVVAEARLLSASKPAAKSDSAKWIREAVESLKRSTDGYDLVIARHLDEIPADAEKQNDPQAVTRLKLLCRKLGLESAIPDEIYSDPDGLFVIFGQMRARIEALLAASNAAPEQCNKPPEGWTCSRVNGHEGPCAASSQPSPTAVVLDERAALTNYQIREIALKYCAYEMPERFYNILRYDCEEDFFNLVRDLLNRAASPQPVAQPVEQTRPLEKWTITKPKMDGSLGYETYVTYDAKEAREAGMRGWGVAAHMEVAQPVEQTRALTDDPIALLIAKHAEELENNEYAYFELAYTRRTEWMAWICSNHRDEDSNRKVIARGQGSTPQEACDNALTAARPASGETE